MKMPGFTAEAALKEKDTYYRMQGRDIRASGALEPAFFFCHGYYCCDEYGYCIYRGPVLF